MPSLLVGGVLGALDDAVDDLAEHPADHQGEHQQAEQRERAADQDVGQLGEALVGRCGRRRCCRWSRRPRRGCPPRGGACERGTGGMRSCITRSAGGVRTVGIGSGVPACRDHSVDPSRAPSPPLRRRRWPPVSVALAGPALGRRAPGLARHRPGRADARLRRARRHPAAALRADRRGWSTCRARARRGRHARRRRPRRTSGSAARARPPASSPPPTPRTRRPAAPAPAGDPA